MFCLLHIVENMFADNYKKNHKEHAAGEYPIVRGRGLGSKRTPGILIRVKGVLRYVLPRHRRPEGVDEMGGGS